MAVWKKRKCEACGRTFNKMTDEVWKNVQKTHKRSIGHKKRIKRKSR
jgi:hypothetical protein